VALNQSTVDSWWDVRNVRDIANKRIEEHRAKGSIGSSLQAELDIYAFDKSYESLIRLGDDLKFAFITSRVTVHHRKDGGLGIDVAASIHGKCERCWHYRADVGANAEHPLLCGRCVSNLFGSGEVRTHA
jgi:isoleucyl-tRNA synthetase